MKRLLSSLLLGASLAVLPISASAQYPAKLIKLIVPFGPGSPPDIVARVTAQKMSEVLGQPIVVENRPGAAGTIGATAAAKSPGDGYTLLLGTTGSLAIAPSLYPAPGYDPVRSFAPITRLTTSVFLVFVHVSVPANSLNELVELAKSRSGELAFGSGVGSPLHIAGEMFKMAAGVNLLHVPYSTNPFTDFAAGRTQVMFEQLPALLPHLRSGKIRALAVAGPNRISQLPDVPTAAEAGLPGYEVNVWSGLLVPAGTPKDIVARLNAEALKVLASVEVRDAFAKLGLEPAGNSPEQFAALIGVDGAKWSRAIKQSGAKLD